MKQQNNLFDLLQKEFCPPLDSSLIAALLIELESDAEGHPVSPSQHDIDNLYVTCSALALQADESQQSEFSGSDVLQTSQIDETISSWTTPDYNHEQPLGSKSGSSGFSISSQHSPLEFLQAALPDVPTPRLRHALLYADNEDVDLWDIIAGILTDESNLEIDERGHDGLEDVLFLGGIDFEWQPAESEKKPSTKERKKKIRPRSNKFALSDIRQQHHTRPSSKRGSIIKQSTTSDPWTQISSLSTHVASLLPPHPPSFFQSFFHSPNHATSYDALRAALTSLCKQDADNYIATVSYLMDIILPDIGGVDPELDARITADIQLSVAVADGRANDALDLVNLLRDLDTRPEMGLSHLLPTQASNSGGDARPSGARLPYSSGPLLVSSSKVKSKIRPPSTPSEDKLSTYQWHVIPQRKIVADNSSPHAYHIDECKRRLAEATLKRSELLQEAKRMSKTHGGGAAQHYAERSNEYLALAKKEALNLARAKVQASRKRDSVDFHGVGVENAIIIMQEILEKQKLLISQAEPLTIITGRGNHSVNKKSVLKPALWKFLDDEGWLVSEWTAGLVVTGRRAAA